MGEILPCRFCGGTAFFDSASVLQYWRCPKIGCGASGPANDRDGAKWNAAMRVSGPNGDPLTPCAKCGKQTLAVCNKCMGLESRRFEAACAAMVGLFAEHNTEWTRTEWNNESPGLSENMKTIARLSVAWADELLAALDAKPRANR